MERKRKLYWAKTAAIFTAIPVMLWAFEYGPDPGFAGVPGENGSCANVSCHLGTANNPANQGSVTVNFPGAMTYTPGVKQHLTVTIADPAATQHAWGFELTARSAATPSTMEGTFASTDANTQLMCSVPNLQAFGTVAFGGPQTCPAAQTLQYIEHSVTGYTSTKGPGSGTYGFDWTPPATNVGNITIYVAGNAANGDLTTSGDHIYSTTYTLTPATGGGSTPTITEVDNAFSNIANSPIQAGTWVAIKGTNLSNTPAPGRGWNANENFPTSMDGTSVTINGKTAFMYYISPTQVNVQAPTDSALGPVSVVVTNNGTPSAAATATYQTNSPALLQWGGGQYPYALITNGATYVGNPAVISNTVSAKAGQALTLWATGLGPTNPPLPAGQQPTAFPPLVTNPTVTVGGANVTVLGAVLRFAGLYQVNIQLPASLATGDMPIKIIQGSFQSPNSILINVQ